MQCQIPTFPLTFDEIPYPGGIKFKSQGLRRRSYPGPSRSKINPTSKRLNHFVNNNLSGYCKTHSGFESFPIYFQGSSFVAALRFWIELRSKFLIRLFNENGNSIWQWYLWKHVMYWALALKAFEIWGKALVGSVSASSFYQLNGTVDPLSNSLFPQNFHQMV